MGTEKRIVIDFDVEQGLREVSESLHRGVAGLFVGRGPAGFAVIAGAIGKGVVGAGHGHMVAVSMTEAGLRALRDRCNSLLGEPAQKPPLPDGLVLS
jgi:hypothetical protein